MNKEETSTKGSSLIQIMEDDDSVARGFRLNLILENTGDLIDEQLKWIGSGLEMERW